MHCHRVKEGANVEDKKARQELVTGERDEWATWGDQCGKVAVKDSQTHLRIVK